MSAESVALAKVRARVRREIEKAEEAETEGGELNLVPYLDIITNTVIFMLATAALALSLANINVSAPRYAEPSAGAAEQEDDDDQPKLNLTVAITDTGFTVGGAGGILPKIECKGPLRSGRCPAYIASRPGRDGESESYWIDQYDYKGLSELMQKVKKQWAAERQAVITADRRIPYQIVVKTMDIIRGPQSTTKCSGDDGCYFDQVVLSAGVQ